MARDLTRKLNRVEKLSFTVKYGSTNITNVGEWIGTYEVVITGSRGKTVVVEKDAGSALERFNTTPVKPSLQPENVAISFLNILNRAFWTNASQSSTSSYSHTPLEEYRHLH